MKTLTRLCGNPIFRVALLSLNILTTMPLAAQASRAASPALETQNARTRSAMILDERVKVLAKNLNLSETQQSAVKEILEQRQQETLRIRLDRSISGEARFQRFRALQDHTVQRIRAVLNEEQRKKYDPLAVRRIQPSPDRRSVDDWLKTTTPH
jgi:hypothetical protein